MREIVLYISMLGLLVIIIQIHVEKAWYNDIGTHCMVLQGSVQGHILYSTYTTKHFDETVAREDLEQFKTTRG